MIFIETKLEGTFILEPEPIADERGFFARAWCEETFAAHGLDLKVAQANISYSRKKGTLRGLHYQIAPYQEVKVVRCTRGAIYDVIVDLRPDSPTYLEWMGVELTEANHLMLYVPRGFAHGFLTLAAHSEVFYPASVAYTPGAERGIRYDDPAFAIEWPTAVQVVSEKDRSWPDYAVRNAAVEETALS